MKKKIPLRKCVSCGLDKAKGELIRVVKTKDSGVVIDQTGKQNGRGAYICKNEACISDAESKGKLAKSLKAKIDEEVFKNLNDVIK